MNTSGSITISPVGINELHLSTVVVLYANPNPDKPEPKRLNLGLSLTAENDKFQINIVNENTIVNADLPNSVYFAKVGDKIKFTYWISLKNSFVIRN